MIKITYPTDMHFEENEIQHKYDYLAFIAQYGNDPFFCKRIDNGLITVIHGNENDKIVRAYYFINGNSHTGCEPDSWPCWELRKCTNWTINKDFFNTYIETNYKSETYRTLGIPRIESNNKINKTMTFRNCKIIMNELTACADKHSTINICNYTNDIRAKYYLTRKYSNIFDSFFNTDTKYPKNTLKNRIIWAFRYAAANAVTPNVFDPEIDLKGLEFPDGYIDTTDMTQIFERIQ